MMAPAGMADADFTAFLKRHQVLRRESKFAATVEIVLRQPGIISMRPRHFE